MSLQIYDLTHTYGQFSRNGPLTPVLILMC